MSIEGQWRITEMNLWDEEAIDRLGPAFIEFKGRGGQFRFIAVEGRMDCRREQRNGPPLIDFAWEGNDECDPANGRGRVTLQQDGSLTGHIYFHRGDDSGFKATPINLDDKPTRKARPTRKGGSA